MSCASDSFTTAIISGLQVADPLNLLLARSPWFPGDHAAALLTDGMVPRRFRAHDTPLSGGGHRRGVYLLLAGVGCRYVMLPSGQRQIIGFVLPGELCDARACLFERIDFSVAAVSAIEANFIPAESLASHTEHSPAFLRALWQSTAVDDAIDRQWLLNLGHRNALERLAHLLCEIFMRLQVVGLTDQNSCRLPLTQMDLADASALSLVHVNRTLMELRRMGLISLRTQRLTIHDTEALWNVAGFDPAYLLPRALDECSSTGREAQQLRAHVNA